MHPADIKAAIEKAGFNQTTLARSMRDRFGKPLTSSAVHQIVTGRGVSARVAREISKVTGIPVAQLWPGKYPDLEAEQRAGVRARPASPQRAARPRTTTTTKEAA